MVNLDLDASPWPGAESDMLGILGRDFLAYGRLVYNGSEGWYEFYRLRHR